MSVFSREVLESPLPAQGVDERIAYSLTTTPWGSTPTSVVVKLKTWPDGKDVTTEHTSGSASVAGDVITTPLIIGLKAGMHYRLEIQFVVSGNTFEAFGFVDGET
jgi:hypothetical protein